MKSIKNYNRILKIMYSIILYGMKNVKAKQNEMFAKKIHSIWCMKKVRYCIYALMLYDS